MPPAAYDLFLGSGTTDRTSAAEGDRKKFQILGIAIVAGN
jgi:hypothetical protein